MRTDEREQLLVGEAKVIDQALVDARRYADTRERQEQLDVARKTLAALPAKFRAAPLDAERLRRAYGAVHGRGKPYTWADVAAEYER